MAAAVDDDAGGVAASVELRGRLFELRHLLVQPGAQEALWGIVLVSPACLRMAVRGALFTLPNAFVSASIENRIIQ
jgi:hypothetical protein